MGELRQLLHESRESEARAAGEAEAMAAELAELRERLQASREQERVVSGLRGDVERLTESCQEYDARHERLTRELEQLHSQAELERYRAVDVERRKWEEQEARMVEQLREAKQRQTTPSPGETPDRGERLAIVGGRPSESRPVTPVVSSGGVISPSEGEPVASVVVARGHLRADLLYLWRLRGEVRGRRRAVLLHLWRLRGEVQGRRRADLWHLWHLRGEV